jgi:hypothetical protein
MMRSVAIMAAVLIVFSPAVAAAQQTQDGKPAPTNGPSFWPTGGTDGTTMRAARFDTQGILKITEEYPDAFQAVSQNLCSAATITASATVNLTAVAFESNSIFGRKYLRIAFSGYTSNCATAGRCGGAIFQPQGSTDGVNYFPILTARMESVAGLGADSVKVDTLQYRLFVDPGTSGVWVPLYDLRTGHPFPFKFLRIGIFNRGATSLTSTTLEVAGRQN